MLQTSKIQLWMLHNYFKVVRNVRLSSVVLLYSSNQLHTQCVYYILIENNLFIYFNVKFWYKQMEFRSLNSLNHLCSFISAIHLVVV